MMRDAPPLAVASDAGGARSVSEAITFGRSSRTTVPLTSRGSDRSLSRLVGSFRWDGSRWVLHNEGGHQLVVNLDGGSRAELAPGGWPLALPHGARGTVSVQTLDRYDLTFDVGVASSTGEPDEHLAMLTDEPTEHVSARLQLTDDELLLIAALCEPRLRDPGAASFEVPGNRNLARRLGVSAKKVEDLIDSVSRKLAPVLDGLLGSNAQRATTRRHRIAEFAIRSRCVEERDLRRLP